ncbi:hypothetical protein GOBAR_DD30646 [Gossypium barbadense]|nr:hypothetical protein GOBAR_DD30646 [Gossypium barbadense]
MLSLQTQTSVTAPSSSFERCRFLGARSTASYRLLRIVATLKVPGISRIQVPRQKYIPVSKAELLDAIVSSLFESRDEDARQFRLLSSCLDSILHAEHKSILEQMRTDYYYSYSVEGNRKTEHVSESEVVANGERSKFTDEDNIEPDTWFNYGLDLRNFLNSSAKNVGRFSDDKSRVAVATRFQRSFMQLLNDAQFEELSVRDLMLTNALNTDYLLTLPIYVDWKKASESNAIIFRRGYATERQNGLLIVEKLDYLQSRLLQGFFSIISKPLGKVGKWITYNLKEAFKSAYEKDKAGNWVRRLKLWLEELSLFQQSYLNDEQNSESLLGGMMGRVELTSAYMFFKKPTFLSRISLGDIWRPATRKYCGNDVWKMLKTSVSILLSQSILQEPAFQELILLYTKDFAEGDIEEDSEVQALELKIYERIPIPDLSRAVSRYEGFLSAIGPRGRLLRKLLARVGLLPPTPETPFQLDSVSSVSEPYLVVFPHKKLSFRIIDTVRLDVATILGLSAFLINYKFEDILSSPSAIVLDVVAITALIIYVSRVALGYKQTWDRYQNPFPQLLVNKTLYEKTLASGFGSVHFLLDASEQQQYKEAILTYAVLLNMENGQANCYQKVGDKCERFIYDIFKQKVEMPVDKAVNTLVRLGLVTETIGDGRLKLQAIPCPKAYEALKCRWESLLG